MVIAFETAKKSIATDLRAELGKQTEPLAKRRVVRVESHFPDTDLVEWLAAQQLETKVYWSDRDGGFAAAGVGVAAEMFAEDMPDMDRLFARMNGDMAGRHPHLRYYGGFRFDVGRAVGDAWKPFGAYRFVAPKFELGRNGNCFFFAFNVLVQEGEAPADHIERSLAFLDEIDLSEKAFTSQFPRAQSREDRPDEQAWRVIVEAALDQLNGGDLNKVVLARESRFGFTEPIDASKLLHGLIENTTYSFHFAFQFEKDSAFVGASPERLYKRANMRLQSEALAGTRPRVSDPEETEALGRALMESPKERYEHQLVVDHLLRVFDEHCRAVRGGDRTELLVLKHVQHLLTRIEGMLDGDVSDAALLTSLHPTPALGGAPTEKAKEAIARLEPFERGWFAGPVGWVGFDSSEFAVAIRSGLIQGPHLSVYTGAGIVPGSDPGREWDEIETKMTGFLRVMEGQD